MEKMQSKGCIFLFTKYFLKKGSVFYISMLKYKESIEPLR